MPSREGLPDYAQQRKLVEELVGRINGEFGDADWVPVRYLYRSYRQEQLARLYRAAAVGIVTPLKDGMNLVAKEFVAAREDERGVLVLSRFTGAARELSEALVVNPYDLEEASAALATALAMPAEQQAERMRAMRRLVAEFNVYRWAGRMLVDASRVRQAGRLSDRLTMGLRAAEDLGA